VAPQAALHRHNGLIMASKAVKDAVSARLGVAWNGLPVTGPNEDAATSAGSFLALQFPVANNRRMTIDRGRYREEGAFRIVINGERAVGADQVLGWADDLAALFRDQQFDGVVCGVPGSPFLDDRNDMGNYFQVAVVFPYHFDF
jgi:hypothetical protein